MHGRSAPPEPFYFSLSGIGWRVVFARAWAGLSAWKVIDSTRTGTGATGFLKKFKSSGTFAARIPSIEADTYGDYLERVAG